MHLTIFTRTKWVCSNFSNPANCQSNGWGLVWSAYDCHTLLGFMFPLIPFKGHVSCGLPPHKSNGKNPISRSHNSGMNGRYARVCKPQSRANKLNKDRADEIKPWEDHSKSGTHWIRNPYKWYRNGYRFPRSKKLCAHLSGKLQDMRKALRPWKGYVEKVRPYSLYMFLFKWNSVGKESMFRFF